MNNQLVRIQHVNRKLYKNGTYAHICRHTHTHAHTILSLLCRFTLQSIVVLTVYYRVIKGSCQCHLSSFAVLLNV